MSRECLNDEQVHSSLEYLRSKYKDVILIDPLLTNACLTNLSNPKFQNQLKKIIHSKTRFIFVIPIVLNGHWSFLIGYKTKLVHFDTITGYHWNDAFELVTKILNLNKLLKGKITQQNSDYECGTLIVIAINIILEKAHRSFPHKIQQSISLQTDAGYMKDKRDEIIKISNLT